MGMHFGVAIAIVLPPRSAFGGGATEKRYANIARIKLYSRKGKSRTLFFTSGKARSSSLLFPSKAKKPSLQSSDLVSFLAKHA